jgi:hypothetical protein
MVPHWMRNRWKEVLFVLYHIIRVEVWFMFMRMGSWLRNGILYLIPDRNSAMNTRYCLFFIIATVTVVQCDRHRLCPAEYDRWQYLDGATENYLLCWKVDWSDETITFQAKVTTTGWLGLRFSPSGQMPNSDFVIGWVRDGQPYLSVRYSLLTCMW